MDADIAFGNAQVVALVREILEERVSPRRTAKADSRLEFPNHVWTDDRVREWRAAQ